MPKGKNEPHSAIFAIVNRGFTDLVMNAAREAGAKGGSVLTCRGTSNKEMEKFFGVSVSPEKEMVLIVVKSDIRDKVLLSINEQAGMSTRGKGIAFSLPVEDVVGIKEIEDVKGK